MAGTDMRVALITGSTSGIGREIAFQLAAKGWAILLTGREAEKGRATFADLRHLYPHDSHALWLGDLASLSAVHELAVWAIERHVNVLINNVGGAFPADSTLRNGFSLTFLMNLMTPWLLTRQLLPHLLEQEDARIVCTSTSLHYYSDGSALALARAQQGDGPLNYGIVKLAQLAWLQHLANEMQGRPIAILAADPGIAETDNFAANYTGVTGALLRAFWLGYPDFQTKRNAARPAVLAASEAKYVGVQGKYVGPDGRRMRMAQMAKDLAFGRRVEVMCERLLDGDEGEKSCCH